MKKNGIKAPKHLKAEGDRLWRDIQAEYGLNDVAGLYLLTSLAENWQLMVEARCDIEKNGLVIVNQKTGMRRQNPVCGILKEARTAFYRALALLDLKLPESGDNPIILDYLRREAKNDHGN